jgi:hypothetical protein
MLNSEYNVITIAVPHCSPLTMLVWLSLLKQGGSIRGINTRNAFIHFNIPSSKAKEVPKLLAYGDQKAPQPNEKTKK